MAAKELNLSVLPVCDIRGHDRLPNALKITVPDTVQCAIQNSSQFLVANGLESTTLSSHQCDQHWYETENHQAGDVPVDYLEIVVTPSAYFFRASASSADIFAEALRSESVAIG